MKGIYLAAGILFILASFAIAQLQPAEDAVVMIDWNDGKHSYSNFTFTGSDGYYEMNVASGNVNVSTGMTFNRGNELLMIGNWSGNFLINGTEWRNFTLFMPHEDAKIYGYVYNNASHATIEANVSIYFESFDKKYAGLNYTLTQNGYYEIWLPASNVSIDVSANGYKTAFYSLNISSGEEKEIDFYLDASPVAPLTAWVAGYVKSIDGQPISNASVELYIHNDIYNYTSINFTYTPSNGYFKFKVPAGNGSIIVNADDFFPHLGNISTEEGVVTWINISLIPFPQDNAWVCGYVYDNEGNPIAGANVSIEGRIIVNYFQTGYFYRYGTTNESGYYNISVPSVDAEWIPPGIIINVSAIDSVYASKEGYFDNSSILTPPSNVIEPGQTLHVDTILDRMPEENSMVRGYVYLASLETRHILYVGGSGPNNYTTIQAAIENASNGDTIKVYPGVYDGGIIINKEIKLIGDPTIDGHGGYGIKIEASNVIIENFTVYNFSTGIYVHNASFTIKNVTISNCTVYNPSKHGAGIKFEYVEKSLISNTSVNNTGDGITLRYSSHNIISNCVSYNNKASGIFLFSSSNNNVTKCTSSNNRDGIYIDNAAGKNNIVCYNTFSSNSRYGIIITYSTGNYIYLNNFIDNADNGHSMSGNTFHSPSTISYHYGGNEYTNYLGNYWNDYNGNDANNDGIGDESYAIDSNVYDDYPLMRPWEIYFGGVIEPTIVYVDDDYNESTPGWGYDHFASIADGIDGVASGGTAYVYEGVYEGSIGINKEVSIISLNGSENTIIKASGQNAVTMNYPCMLDGFTIRDAHANYDNVRGIWVRADGCIIRNVTITNITAIQNDSITIYTYGIMINHADNCTIENVTICDIEGNDSTAYGIYTYESNNNSFKDITIFNITSVDIAYGIYISHGKDGELFSIDISNVNGSNSYGIQAYSADNYILRWINVTESKYGIILDGSNYNIIENCVASNDTLYGIGISGATHNVIRNNSVYGNSKGITLWMGCYNNTIENNTIFNNQYHGIYFNSNDMFNTIKENIIYNSPYGIYLGSSAGNNTILSNHIYNNSIEGVRIYSNHNNISFNYIHNNLEYGILISQSQSENNTVYGNYIYDNGQDGIHISEHSSNNIIISNHIYDNSYYGIKLFYYTSHNLIENNHIYNNNYGIYIGSSNNNTIYSNRICSNNYGIYLSSSNNNLIYNNYFNNTINAYDNGNNTWNISKTAGINIIGGNWLGGNYWSDYAGVDTNKDGIGDTMLPYNCNGRIVHDGDMLPLVYVVNDTIPPAITNITFPSKAHAGINITCIVSDNADIAGVWINITLPDGSYINESMQYCHGIYYFNASFDIEGNYSFRIYAIDTNGNVNMSMEKMFQVYPIWDINMDDHVNVLDLIIVAMHFGSHEGEEGYDKSVDLNGDKEINVLDLIIVAMHWTG